MPLQLAIKVKLNPLLDQLEAKDLAEEIKTMIGECCSEDLLDSFSFDAIEVKIEDVEPPNIPITSLMGV